jgi:hypothetical protein
MAGGADHRRVSRAPSVLLRFSRYSHLFVYLGFEFFACTYDPFPVAFRIDPRLYTFAGSTGAFALEVDDFEVGWKPNVGLEHFETMEGATRIGRCWGRC